MWPWIIVNVIVRFEESMKYLTIISNIGLIFKYKKIWHYTYHTNIEVAQVIINKIMIKVNNKQKQQKAFRERRHLRVCDIWP